MNKKKQCYSNCLSLFFLLCQPDGGLVANAPHLPVHLGSMQEAVRWQINHLGDNWKEGTRKRNTLIPNSL